VAATLNEELLGIQVMRDGARLTSEPRELVNVSLESVRYRRRTVPEWPTSSALVAPASVRPLAVMVVDDDTFVLHSTAAMLEDLGHRVFQATSGEQALSLLGQHPEVDVLITDHAMPNMTGAELATMVQTISPSLPVVLATGYAELPIDLAPALTRLAKPSHNEISKMPFRWQPP
jgi:CheY-like chemotaxis protein